MEITIKQLQDYLLEHYKDGGIDQSLFMKLVEEIGEVAEETVSCTERDSSVGVSDKVSSGKVVSASLENRIGRVSPALALLTCRNRRIFITPRTLITPQSRMTAARGTAISP